MLTHSLLRRGGDDENVIRALSNLASISPNLVITQGGPRLLLALAGLDRVSDVVRSVPTTSDFEGLSSLLSQLDLSHVDEQLVDRAFALLFQSSRQSVQLVDVHDVVTLTPPPPPPPPDLVRHAAASVISQAVLNNPENAVALARNASIVCGLGTPTDTVVNPSRNAAIPPDHSAIREAVRAIANAATHPQAASILVRNPQVLSCLARAASVNSDVRLKGEGTRGLMNLANDSTRLGDGLYALHASGQTPPSNPCADIVFIHGVNGCAFGTWGSRATQFWPLSWLASDIPCIRVLTYQYQTSLSGWGGADVTLEERAATLLTKLIDAGVGSRPVVFVAHSMGGLVLKEMLSHPSRLLNSTRGVIFYATPHRGSIGSEPGRRGRVDRMADVLVRPTPTWHVLRRHSPMTLALNWQFAEFVIRRGIPVLSLGETESMTYATIRGKQLRAIIVDSHSANPGFGDFVELQGKNHSQVCKPVDLEDDAYILPLAFIKEVIERQGSKSGAVDDAEAALESAVVALAMTLMASID